MKSNERDKLDELIDGALSGYSDAEPLAGLEERILNRMRAPSAAPYKAWSRGWVFAIAALSSLLFAVVALWTLRIPAPKTTHVASAPTTPAPPAIRSHSETARIEPEPREPKARNRSVSKRVRPPKEQYIPAPLPITGEERALLAFVQRGPVKAQEALADLRNRGNEPVEIQAIQIQPLQSNGGQ